MNNKRQNSGKNRRTEYYSITYLIKGENISIGKWEKWCRIGEALACYTFISISHMIFVWWLTQNKLSIQCITVKVSRIANWIYIINQRRKKMNNRTKRYNAIQNTNDSTNITQIQWCVYGFIWTITINIKLCMWKYSNKQFYR